MCSGAAAVVSRIVFSVLPSNCLSFSNKLVNPWCADAQLFLNHINRFAVDLFHGEGPPDPWILGIHQRLDLFKFDVPDNLSLHGNADRGFVALVDEAVPADASLSQVFCTVGR